jgi:hypothetical protein
MHPRSTRRFRLLFGATAGLLCSLLLPLTARTAESHLRALVAPDGELLACIGQGAFVFADNCRGPVDFEFIHPFQAGSIVWRMGKGEAVSDPNPPDPPGDCPQARLKWNKRAETPQKSDVVVTRLDHTAPELRKRIQLGAFGQLRGEAQVTEAYSVDLDGNGVEDIVFLVNDLPAAVAAIEKAGKETTFTIAGGVLKNGQGSAQFFYHEQDTYRGGTDAIGSVELVGLVRLDPGSHELSVVADVGNMFSQARIIGRSGPNGMLVLSLVRRACY